MSDDGSGDSGVDVRLTVFLQQRCPYLNTQCALAGLLSRRLSVQERRSVSDLEKRHLLAAITHPPLLTADIATSVSKKALT